MSIQLEMITNLPMAMIVLDQNLDLAAASREAFLQFHVRLHPESYNKSLIQLSNSIMKRKELVSMVGAATMRLRSLYSRETFDWLDGERDFEVTVFTMPPEEDMLYGVYFNDVSLKVESERARESARNYLEIILDSLPLGVVVMDCDLKITSINTAQQEMMKLVGREVSLLQLVGADASSVLPQSDEITWEDLRKLVLEENEVLYGISETHGDGDEALEFSISYAPLQDIRGNITGTVRITEDITQQVALQKEARQAEVLSARLETVQHMAVTLKHEVNTSLTAIRGHAELLSAIGSPLPEDKHDQVKVIIEGADRIADLIQRITSTGGLRTVDYLSDGQEQMIDFYDSGTRE